MAGASECGQTYEHGYHTTLTTGLFDIDTESDIIVISLLHLTKE